jgi:predicted acylesterase/phospholipase RssA
LHQHVAEAKPVHLLLGAGGVRCLAYVGALMQLESEGYQVETVSTASAGTLIGALYCAGVRPQEMLDAVLALDLRRAAGDPGRWVPLRRLWTLRRWPYALYREPGIPDVFGDILRSVGKDPDPLLGNLEVPLSTAAVDVAGQRMLVYTSHEHPDMRVRELLRIAVAIPLMYRPHQRQGREIMDASLASYAPIWLAAGQRGDRPIVVLRTQGRQFRSRRLLPWLFDAVQGGVVSRDTFELERLPRTTVHDVVTDVDAFAFDLSRQQILDLVELGRQTVAVAGERSTQEFIGPSQGPERRAELAASGLFGRHLDRLARARKPAVFLSYAREDKAWVQRLRSGLTKLLADTGVDVWDDSYIPSGSVWLGAIEDAIGRARVAVLVVSEHFRASDFIRDTELELLRSAYRTGQLRLLWLSIDGTTPEQPEQEIQALRDPHPPLTALADADVTAAMSAMARAIEEAYYAAPAG